MRAGAKKQETLESIYIYLLTFYSGRKARYANAVKTSLSIYSIHPNFPDFTFQTIEFCALKIATSVMSKALCNSQKNIFFNSKALL